MFQLTAKEFANLKSQIVISSWGGLRRAAPYAFTEQGVAMLASVLTSKRRSPSISGSSRPRTSLNAREPPAAGDRGGDNT